MKNFRKSSFIAVILVFVLLFSACGSKVQEESNVDNTTNEVTDVKEDVKSDEEKDEEDSNDLEEDLSLETKYPVTIKDSRSVELTIDKEPDSIISLAPNMTEMVYALGKGDSLVGRTTYCDYPEEVSEIEDIGDAYNLNIERIVELNPDLVIGYFEGDALTKLEEAGIKVAILNTSDSFDGIYGTIETLGEALNTKEKANEIISSIKNDVEEVKNKASEEKPSVYYVVGFGENGDFTATGDTFVGEMIEIAGGENIAKEGTAWMFSKEALVEKNPDIIIISKYYDQKNTFINTDLYKDLDAVKNGKVYEIDNNKLDRQGVRSGEGLKELSAIITGE